MRRTKNSDLDALLKMRMAIHPGVRDGQKQAHTKEIQAGL
jgi:hypothetical protein